MSQRYVVETSLDGVHRIWDKEEEQSVFMSSGEVEAVEEIAMNMNNNQCAICGEQCGEAHSRGRAGKVCEDCTDEFVDENGEVNWEKVRNGS